MAVLAVVAVDDRFEIGAGGSDVNVLRGGRVEAYVFLRGCLRWSWGFVCRERHGELKKGKGIVAWKAAEDGGG